MTGTFGAALPLSSTTTVISEEWRRPCFSVTGTRWIRWDPARIESEGSKAVEHEQLADRLDGTTGVLGNRSRQLAREHLSVRATLSGVDLHGDHESILRPPGPVVALIPPHPLSRKLVDLAAVPVGGAELDLGPPVVAFLPLHPHFASDPSAAFDVHLDVGAVDWLVDGDVVAVGHGASVAVAADCGS